MDASAVPSELANCGGSTSRKRAGRKARPKVSTSPTRIEPIRAPRTEPMPPMTITTKARMRMLSPMPTCTAKIGPSMAPATAHRAAPTPNTSVNRSLMSTPMMVAISRLEAPARTRMPTRVFATRK